MGLWYRELEAFLPSDMERVRSSLHATLNGRNRQELIEVVQNGRHREAKRVRERLQARYQTLASDENIPELLLHITWREAHPKEYLLDRLKQEDPIRIDEYKSFLALYRRDRRKFHGWKDLLWALSGQPQDKELITSALTGTPHVVQGVEWISSGFVNLESVVRIATALASIEIGEPAPNLSVHIPAYEWHRGAFPGDDLDTSRALYIHKEGEVEHITDSEISPLPYRAQALKRASRDLDRLQKFYAKCATRGWTVICGLLQE